MAAGSREDDDPLTSVVGQPPPCSSPLAVRVGVTAQKYLSRVEDALGRILEDARADDVPLRPTTMSAM